MQTPGLHPQRSRNGRSRGVSEDKMPPVDASARVPWAHSEKCCCEREACPRSTGEDVQDLSLSGFEEGFQKGQQLSQALRDVEEVVRQTGLWFGVIP